MSLIQTDLIKALINDKDFLYTVAERYDEYVRESEGEPNWDLEKFTTYDVEWIKQDLMERELEDEHIVENPSGRWGFRDGVE
jgi:hypothetical protein